MPEVAEFTELHDAYWFLVDHPIFKDSFNEERFNECVRHSIKKVNPDTREIDDDASKNTEVVFWFEAGPWHIGDPSDPNDLPDIASHDTELDFECASYESGIIKMANLVLAKYGTGLTEPTA